LPEDMLHASTEQRINNTTHSTVLKYNVQC
jgi:hypothetical protein